MASIHHINLRTAVDSDLSIIETIWQKGLKENDLLVADDALQRFRNNFHCRNGLFDFWVAEKITILGWCSILPAFSHPMKKFSNGEVSTYIDNQTELKGVGTILMKHVFTQLCNTEIDTIFGFASHSNFKSIRMCENAGMKICGETSKRIILVKEFR